MKTVMNHSHDGWLLKMISRTDPVILVGLLTIGDINKTIKQIYDD